MSIQLDPIVSLPKDCSLKILSYLNLQLGQSSLAQNYE